VFHPRCTLAQESCKQSVPVLDEQTEGHWVACPVVK